MSLFPAFRRVAHADRVVHSYRDVESRARAHNSASEGRPRRSGKISFSRSALVLSIHAFNCVPPRCSDEEVEIRTTRLYTHNCRDTLPPLFSRCIRSFNNACASRVSSHQLTVASGDTIGLRADFKRTTRPRDIYFAFVSQLTECRIAITASALRTRVRAWMREGGRYRSRTHTRAETYTTTTPEPSLHALKLHGECKRVFNSGTRDSRLIQRRRQITRNHVQTSRRRF